jgi:hypothetical protein
MRLGHRSGPRRRLVAILGIGGCAHASRSKHKTDGQEQGGSESRQRNAVEMLCETHCFPPYRLQQNF